MKSIFLVCAVCLHLGGSYGSDDTDGVGAFAYQDSTGNSASPPFIPPPLFIRPPPFRRSFFKPNFFTRTFESSVENQQLAYDAARKAFDVTSNQAGYYQNFNPTRFPFGGDFPRFGGAQGFPGPQGFPGSQGFPGAHGFPGQQGLQGIPGFRMPNFRRSENSAFASSALGPDFSQQVAEISPANPNNPNINKFSSSSSGPGGYKSVSSSAIVSSSVVNGKETSSRRAETIVNNDGVVTKYKVES